MLALDTQMPFARLGCLTNGRRCKRRSSMAETISRFLLDVPCRADKLSVDAIS
jgi:hypothetical protein